MSVLDNFKNKNFWIAVFKLGVVFFIIFVLLSAFISNFSAVVAGDFSAVYEQEWGDGKWKADLGIKAAITIIYAVYMTSRRQNFEKKTS